jgi:putative protease
MAARRKKTVRRKPARSKATRSRTAKRKPAARKAARGKRAAPRKRAKKAPAARKPGKRAAPRKAARRAAPKPARPKAAKPARPAAKPPAAAAPKPAVAPAPAAATGRGPLAAGVPELVGRVTHYFAHANAGVIAIEQGALRVGDTVHFRGHTTDFYQRVERLELDHQPVEHAGAGQEVGIQVTQRVREHDAVYRVSL